MTSRVTQVRIFIFSRTTGSISIKLGTEHSWVKGIQVCAYVGSRPFPREEIIHGHIIATESLPQLCMSRVLFTYDKTYDKI